MISFLLYAYDEDWAKLWPVLLEGKELSGFTDLQRHQRRSHSQFFARASICSLSRNSWKSVLRFRWLFFHAVTCFFNANGSYPLGAGSLSQTTVRTEGFRLCVHERLGLRQWQFTAEWWFTRPDAYWDLLKTLYLHGYIRPVTTF